MDQRRQLNPLEETDLRPAVEDHPEATVIRSSNNLGDLEEVIWSARDSQVYGRVLWGRSGPREVRAIALGVDRFPTGQRAVRTLVSKEGISSAITQVIKELQSSEAR